jgi:ribosome biogenesis GTPase / thiamine phosphate phosphatase
LRTQRTAPLAGLIVASHGRRHLVELPGPAVIDCVTRGRRRDIACGDRVFVAPSAPGQGVIEGLAPRTSLLYRSDAHRQKLVAANVTQIAIVVAPVPGPHEDLLNRCLVAAEHGGMAALIVLNKTDLPGSAAVLRALELYRTLGYRIIALSAKRDVRPLAPALECHVSVLVGQSGTGKSTLINRLLPHAAARTNEISRALESGRHTTTHARLYHLDAASSIIDSPGMQEFGLNHLAIEEAAHAFVEFRPWLGRCRFRDCRHLAEPDCAIADACSSGKVSERRLASYRRLAGELAGTRKRASRTGARR